MAVFGKISFPLFLCILFTSHWPTLDVSADRPRIWGFICCDHLFSRWEYNILTVSYQIIVLGLRWENLDTNGWTSIMEIRGKLQRIFSGFGYGNGDGEYFYCYGDAVKSAFYCISMKIMKPRSWRWIMIAICTSYVHMAKEAIRSIWETSVLAPQMNNAKWNSVMQQDLNTEFYFINKPQ